VSAAGSSSVATQFRSIEENFMSPELKVAIFINALLTVIFGVVVLGAGYAPGLREGVELNRVPIDRAPKQVVAYDSARDNPHARRIEIPAEFRTPDQGAKPRIILPDGSNRFTDKDR
jgi:hypothetical protein